jgi:predicted GIY-YIG superfamily endonuclease
MLVWSEVRESIETGWAPESHIKKCRQFKKAYLIEVHNPYWKDIPHTIM